MSGFTHTAWPCKYPHMLRAFAYGLYLPVVLGNGWRPIEEWWCILLVQCFNSLILWLRPWSSTRCKISANNLVSHLYLPRTPSFIIVYPLYFQSTAVFYFHHKINFLQILPTTDFLPSSLQSRWQNQDSCLRRLHGLYPRFTSLMKTVDYVWHSSSN